MNNEVPTTTEVTQPKKKKLSTFKKVLIGIAGVLVAIVIFVFVATSGAVKISDKFVNAILANDPTTAYSLFSKEAKDVVDQTQFEQIVATMSDVLDETASKTSRGVDSGTDKDTTATVVYEIKGNDGTYEMTVSLIKIDDSWYIQNFDNSLKE